MNDLNNEIKTSDEIETPSKKNRGVKPPIFASVAFALIIIAWVVMILLTSTEQVTPLSIILTIICFILITIRWILYINDKKKENLEAETAEAEDEDVDVDNI